MRAYETVLLVPQSADEILCMFDGQRSGRANDPRVVSWDFRFNDRSRLLWLYAYDLGAKVRRIVENKPVREKVVDDVERP